MPTLHDRARLLARQIQALHLSKSYRQITREDFPGVSHATLNRIAKSNGEWIPKDRTILRALGLVERKEPVPEWVKPIKKAIRKMVRETKDIFGWKEG